MNIEQIKDDFETLIAKLTFIPKGDAQYEFEDGVYKNHSMNFLFGVYQIGREQGESIGLENANKMLSGGLKL